MIFPYVMEGENSFYFLYIIRTIRILTKIVINEKIVMVHGANTATFLHSSATAQTTDMTLELGDQNPFSSRENLIFILPRYIFYFEEDSA